MPVLLLNLPPEEFKDAMAQLEPGTIDERLTHIRDTISGDSIRTQMEATLDPLGLFARAMKPFSSNSSMDQGSALASQDGLFQIALMITRPAGTGCSLVPDFNGAGEPIQGPNVERVDGL